MNPLTEKPDTPATFQSNSAANIYCPSQRGLPGALAPIAAQLSRKGDCDSLALDDILMYISSRDDGAEDTQLWRVLVFGSWAREAPLMR